MGTRSVSYGARVVELRSVCLTLPLSCAASVTARYFLVSKRCLLMFILCPGAAFLDALPLSWCVSFVFVLEVAFLEALPLSCSFLCQGCLSRGAAFIVFTLYQGVSLMTIRVDCCLDGTQISLLVRHVFHSDFPSFHGVISQRFVSSHCGS